MTIVSAACSYALILLLTTHHGLRRAAGQTAGRVVALPDQFRGTAGIYFPQPRADEATPHHFSVHPFGIALGAVFVALVGLEIYGLRTSDLFSQDIWHPAGIRRFERYLEVYAMVVGHSDVRFAALLRRIFCGSHGGAYGCLGRACRPPGHCLFFPFGNALGSQALGRLKSQAVEDQICATLLGTGIYSFAMTFIARLPIHYPAVWIAVLAAPVLLDLRGVRDPRVRLGCSPPARRRPAIAQRAALAVLLLVLIAHWLVVLKPEGSADGLAMHLSIPANIGMQHRLTLEPSRFLWAVMPMGADFSYSIVYILGGEFAARLVVYAMLLAVCTLLYCALRRWTSPTAAYLLTAAFAATPIVQLVTGALFVENFLAAMIVGVVTAIWRFGDTGDRRYFYMAMALGGTAIAAKLGALAFVLISLPFAFLEARRRWRSMGPRPAACVRPRLRLLLAMAAPPYAVAYVKTRNPIFPYLNNKFHSPLLAPGILITDARFKKPLSVGTPFQLTFHTDGYYEGQRGSLGFHYLAFVPLGLLGFAVARRRPAVIAAVVAVGAGAVILSTEPNARYLYAAMPLALIPVGATLAWAAEHQRALYRMLIAFLACRHRAGPLFPSLSELLP